MKIIDLTLELSEKLPVFSGDPEIKIEQLQTFENDQWNMKRLHINGHDGTHVNAQIHGQATGRSLNDYSLDEFIGEAVLFESMNDVQENMGIIFESHNIDMKLAIEVTKKHPKFVGLSAKYEMDIEVEKYFFKQNILCFERLANTNLLPKKFNFYGVPLRIKDGDGSPVRAFAVCS